MHCEELAQLGQHTMCVVLREQKKSVQKPLWRAVLPHRGAENHESWVSAPWARNLAIQRQTGIEQPLSLWRAIAFLPRTPHTQVP